MAAEAPTAAQPEAAQPAEELPDWLKGMAAEAPTVAQPEAAQPAEELPDWLKGMAAEAPTAAQPEAAQPAEELPDWLKGMAAEAPTAAQPEAARPAEELPDWLKGMAAEAPTAAQPEAAQPAEELPDWLKGIVEETPPAAMEWFETPPTAGTQAERSAPMPAEAAEKAQETPEWMAGEETPPGAPPPSLEWKPATIEAAAPPSVTVPPHPKRIGSLSPTRDLHLAQAQAALERGDIRQAVEHYARLIRKGRLLDEVIFDLREALYRYPVDVMLWQTLGDAYMRANRLREALDAYTKAEQLLR
jgi:tetratricopeptide (TPR) repeat protein